MVPDRNQQRVGLDVERTVVGVSEAGMRWSETTTRREVFDFEVCAACGSLVLDVERHAEWHGASA